MVPSFVTVKVTGPAAAVADGVTDHWFRLTATSLLGPLAAGADDEAALALEQAVPTKRHPTNSPIHLACPLIVRSFLVSRKTWSER